MKRAKEGLKKIDSLWGGFAIYNADTLYYI